MKKGSGNLTLDEVRKKVLLLKPGDLVEIEKDEEIIKATVERIYTNTVQFRKQNGMVMTLGYFDASNVNVIKPTSFEERSEDMAMDDITSSFMNI